MTSTVRRKRRTPRAWDKADLKILKQHSKNKTPVRRIARELKRTEGALRQKAFSLGIGLGVRRAA